MKRTASAAALLVASLFPAFAAADPRVGKFVVYDTGTYTIVTSRGARQAQSFVEDLEKFRITLEKMLGRQSTDHSFPTTIVITSKRDWASYLQPRQHVAGYFQSAPFANYMAMDGEAQLEYATPLMFHEYTHYFLSSQFSGEYPPWFNEGMAELMAYTSFRHIKGSAVLRVATHRVQEARDRDWIPFERLIAVNHSSPEYQSHELANAFYAQAWLTVHYAFLGNKDFAKQIFVYLNQLNALRPHEEAARSAFGTNLAPIDERLRAHARDPKMMSGVIAIGEVPAVALPAGKPLSESDAYAVLVNLMLESRGHPDRIRPLVAALSRREPDSARAAILEARLAAHEENDAAFAAALGRAEAALEPADWVARRDLASVLLRRATEFRPLSQRGSADEKADLERALKWFGEAIAHNRQDVKALWGFGTAAVRLDKDLDQAEEALVGAYKLAPSSAQIAMSLANLNGRRQKPDAMIPYLEDTVRFATDLSLRRWAAQTLAEMRKFIAERDAVDAQNKAAREAYEKELAEYEKKYGKRKKKAG
jgi:tetratricopeptide (TPR) repeat protein